jgi:hypothetical protein
MGIRERSAWRKSRIQAHRAANFTEAEEWDLDFWQSQSAEQGLSALVAIRSDVEKLLKARRSNKKAARKDPWS